jgi:hypothetical protein
MIQRRNSRCCRSINITSTADGVWPCLGSTNPVVLMLDAGIARWQPNGVYEQVHQESFPPGSNHLVWLRQVDAVLERCDGASRDVVVPCAVDRSGRTTVTVTLRAETLGELMRAFVLIPRN